MVNFFFTKYTVGFFGARQLSPFWGKGVQPEGCIEAPPPGGENPPPHAVDICTGPNPDRVGRGRRPVVVQPKPFLSVPRKLVFKLLNAARPRRRIAPAGAKTGSTHTFATALMLSALGCRALCPSGA